MKLLTKILIVVVIGFLSVSATLFTMVYGTSLEMLKREIFTRQENVARQLMTRINELLHEKTADIQTVASSHTLKRFIGAQLDYEEALGRLMEYGDTTGPWDILELIDSGTGRVVLSTEKSRMENKIDKDSEVFRAYNIALSGKIYYSDAIVSKETGGLTMIFAAPVINDVGVEKGVVGVVVGYFSWPAVLDILENVEGGLIHLYNANGDIIGTNEIERGGEIFKINVKNTPLWQNAVLSEAKGSFSIIFKATHTEEKAELFSFAKQGGYLKYGGNGWFISLETPTEVAFASARKSSASLAVSFLPTLIIYIFALMFFLWTVILKPVQEVANATKIIAEGNLDYRIKIFSKDEIGELSVFFNKMISKLRESYFGLEEKIKLRASELAEKVVELKDSQKAIINVLEDVEDEKNQADAEKEKLGKILESIGDGVFAVDLNYRIILFNKAMGDICGCDPETAIGRRYDDVIKIFLEKNDKPNIGFIEESMKIGKSTKIKNQSYLLGSGGKKVSIADIASPIRDANGNIVGCVVILRDTTKEKEIEKTKEDFITIASHQLRTPMTAIQWVAERFLKVEKLTDKGKEYLVDIHSSIRKLSDLVNLLLNVSRMEGGEVKLVPEKIELVEYINKYIKEIESLRASKNIEIVFDAHPDKLEVNMDKSAFRNIVQSFVSNSLEYTPAKGRVSLTLKSEGDRFVLGVSDTGIGIPQEFRQQIFKKFARADNAKLVKTDGTGLGLYLTKQAVDLLGGEIWFESEVNKGTTFFARLPKEVKEKEGEKDLV